MLAFVIASAIAYLILDIRFGGRTGPAILRTILVAIIFFLPPGVAVPGMLSSLDAPRRRDAMRQMEEIGRSIETFRAERGRYPARAEIDLPPRDPWRHPYVVEINATGWTLRSYGACGQAGAKSSYRFEQDLVLRDHVWVSDQP